MVDTENPIDYANTARPRAGMVWKDSRELPGMALIVVAVLALVGAMTAAALNDAGWAIGLGVVVLITAVGGISWILGERNRAVAGGRHRRQP